jgi:hypothetical protein
MAEKPRGKPPGKPPVDGGKDGPGRLAEDDRGNISWQWADDAEDLLADDEVGKMERIQALSDPKLELAEDTTPPSKRAQLNERGLKTGYNPYESGTLAKKQWKKKRDLKQLSEWIELKKKMGKQGKDE